MEEEPKVSYLSLVVNSALLKPADVDLRVSLHYITLSKGQMEFNDVIFIGRLFVPTRMLPQNKHIEHMSLTDWTGIVNEIFKIPMQVPVEKPFKMNNKLPVGSDEMTDFVRGQAKERFDAYKDMTHEAYDKNVQQGLEDEMKSQE